jgi:hypothetical protein
MYGKTAFARMIHRIIILHGYCHTKTQPNGNGLNKIGININNTEL